MVCALVLSAAIATASSFCLAFLVYYISLYLETLFLTSHIFVPPAQQMRGAVVLGLVILCSYIYIHLSFLQAAFVRKISSSKSIVIE